MSNLGLFVRISDAWTDIDRFYYVLSCPATELLLLLLHAHAHMYLSCLQMCGRKLSRVICLSTTGTNRVDNMPFTLRNIGGDLDTKRAIEQAVIRGSQVMLLCLLIFPLRVIFFGGGMESCQYFITTKQRAS